VNRLVNIPKSSAQAAMLYPTCHLRGFHSSQKSFFLFIAVVGVGTLKTEKILSHAGGDIRSTINYPQQASSKNQQAPTNTSNHRQSTDQPPANKTTRDQGAPALQQTYNLQPQHQNSGIKEHRNHQQ
jgi:hypothetical protein